MPPLSDQTLLQALQTKQGHRILHLQGTPFEMGLQHGTLLKDLIQENIRKYLKTPSPNLLEHGADRMEEFTKAIPRITSYIPQKYIEEMKGMAQGADVPFHDILLLNLFPEMFHCCVITASHEASYDKTLYHARVLDYSAGKDLQSSAVLIAAKPNDGFAFMNITYAGFIGSVTGMSEAKIAIGEIGGQGYGNWDGMPMSFLLRSILEEAKTLEDAKEILTKTPRTCEYYYVISDGKTQEAFSCYATNSQIQFISPNENYSISPPSQEGLDLVVEKGLSTNPNSIFFKQPKDTLLLTGLSSPERYPVLLERMESKWGSVDEQVLMDAIQRPVSKESNLHNAIFHPTSLTLWVSHAGMNGEPACNQPYVKFTYEELACGFLV